MNEILFTKSTLSTIIYNVVEKTCPIKISDMNELKKMIITRCLSLNRDDSTGADSESF